MPGLAFAAEAIDATAAADEVMGELFDLSPMIEALDKTAPAIPDPSRQTTTFTGIFLDHEAKPIMPNAYDTRAYQRPGVESGRPLIKVSPAEIANQTLALGAPFVIQPKDILFRRETCVTYRVGPVFPMAGGTMQVKVNVAG